MSLELPIFITTVGILAVNLVFYIHKWPSGSGGKE